MSNTNPSHLLAVSPPPFWHNGRTLPWMMKHIVVSLLPVVLFATITWGIPALRVIALSVFVCVATEALCQKMMNREIKVDDFSAVATGLFLAFLLPAAAPWWLVTIAAFLSITFGKMFFGDLGAAPLCAPAVGYILCYISFPLFIDPNIMQLTTDFIDPLMRLKFFGLESIQNISFSDLLLGQQIGGLGASQGFLIFLAGTYLCIKGVLRWEISFSFLAGVIVTASIFQFFAPETSASPLFHLFTGSTMLGAFFLATDLSSSPNRTLTMVAYGFIGGILVMLIRVFGVYTDGVPFAILLINLIMPLLEGIKQKPFGME